MADSRPRRRLQGRLTVPHRLLNDPATAPKAMPTSTYARLEHLIRLWSLHPDHPRRLAGVQMYRAILRTDYGPHPVVAPYVLSVQLDPRTERELIEALHTIAGELANRAGGGRADLWLAQHVPREGWSAAHADRALWLLQEAQRLGLDLESLGVRVSSLTGSWVRLDQVALTVDPKRATGEKPTRRPSITAERVPLDLIWPIVDPQDQANVERYLFSVNQASVSAGAVVSAGAARANVDRVQILAPQVHEQIDQFLSADTDSTLLDLTSDAEAWVDYLYGERYGRQHQRLAAMVQAGVIDWEIDERLGAIRLRLVDPGRARQWWNRPPRRLPLVEDPIRAVFGARAELGRRAIAQNILPENIYDIELELALYYQMRVPDWTRAQPSTEGFWYTQRVFGVTYASTYPTSGFEWLVGTVSGDDSREWIGPFSMYEDAVRQGQQHRALLDAAGGTYDAISRAADAADTMGFAPAARRDWIQSFAESLLGGEDADPLVPSVMARRAARAAGLQDRIRAELRKQALYAQRSGTQLPRYWVTREGELVTIESLDPRGPTSARASALPTAQFRYVTFQDLLQQAGLEVVGLDVPGELRLSAPAEGRTVGAGAVTFEQVADEIRRRLAGEYFQFPVMQDHEMLRRAAELISDLPVSNLSGEELMKLVGVSAVPGYEDVQGLMATLLFGVNPYSTPRLTLQQLRSTGVVQESVLHILSRIGDVGLVGQIVEDVPGSLFVAAAEAIGQNLPGGPGTVSGGAVPGTLGGYLSHLRATIVRQVSGQSINFLGETLRSTELEALETSGRIDLSVLRQVFAAPDRDAVRGAPWKRDLYRRLRELLASRYGEQVEHILQSGGVNIELSNGQTITVRIDLENGRIILPNGRSVRLEGGVFEAPLTSLAYPYPIAVTLQGRREVAQAGAQLAAQAMQPVIQVEGGRYPLVSDARAVYERLRQGDYRVLDIETALGWTAETATEAERAAVRRLRDLGIDPARFVTDIAFLDPQTGQLVYHRTVPPEELLAAAGAAEVRRTQSGILREILQAQEQVLGQAIAGYNVEFDVSILLQVADEIESANPRLARQFRAAVANRQVLDVLALARARMPEAPHVALENVARLLGMEIAQEHQAAADVQLLQSVIERLLEGEAPPAPDRQPQLLLATGGGSVIDEASGQGVYSMRGRVFRPHGRLQRVALPDGTEQYLLLLDELVWSNNRWQVGRTVSLSAPSVALLNDMLNTMTVALDEQQAAHYSQAALTDYYQRMIRRVLNPITEGDEAIELGQFLGSTVTVSEGADLYTTLRYLSRAQVIGSIAEEASREAVETDLSSYVRGHVQALIQSARELPEGRLPDLSVLLPRELAPLVRQLPEDTKRRVIEELLSGLERYAQQEYLYDPRLIRQYLELYRAMPDLMAVYGEPLAVAFRRMTSGELDPRAAAGLWAAATSAITERLLQLEPVQQAAVRPPVTGYGADRWLRIAFPEMAVDVPFGEQLTPGQIESIWRQRLGTVFRRYAGREAPPPDYLFAIGYAHAGLSPQQAGRALESMARYRLGLGLDPGQQRILSQLIQRGMRERAQFERTMIVHELRRAMDPRRELDFYTALVLGSGIPTTYAQALTPGEAYGAVASELASRIGEEAARRRAEQGLARFPSLMGLWSGWFQREPDVALRTAPPATDLVALARTARSVPEAQQVVQSVADSIRTAQLGSGRADAADLVAGTVLPRARRRLVREEAQRLVERYRQFAELAAGAQTREDLLAAHQRAFGDVNQVMVGRRLFSVAPRHLHRPLQYLSRVDQGSRTPILPLNWEEESPRIWEAVQRLQMAERDQVRQRLARTVQQQRRAPSVQTGPAASPAQAAMQSVSEQVAESVAAGQTTGGAGFDWRGFRDRVQDWFERADWGRLGRLAAGISLIGGAVAAGAAVYTYRPRRSEPRSDLSGGRAPARSAGSGGDLIRLGVQARVRKREERERLLQRMRTIREAELEERDNRRVTMRDRELSELDLELARIVER